MESFLSSVHNSQQPKRSLGGLKGRREGGRHCPSDHLEALLQPPGKLLRPAETWVPERHRSKGEARDFRRINMKTRRL